MTFDDFLKVVGQKIAAIRKSKALTQKDTATRAGISYRYFQNIESGAANLTLSTLFKLSRFFNVRVDELLRERSYRDINTPL
jgi:transcriptional regulator with XRE-family HTH domain